MPITSIDIDAEQLSRARALTGAASNREAVDLALRTLVAVRSQPASVERIIGRTFTDEQIDPAAAPAPDA
ncbi:type II toxin-antitoxin system VapB family antitoxin [Salinibacterium sp. SYSU T00001]|uniref:type II toxin-antitoxin system VapB family antitoxin n=1 Tax=Homoserinimonas sedimenticola TaxID=2986805 RepID=UPI0022364AAF|nr:type II toxin-antitoxin system VapB family antitoxin [Salinibacterium sedimenticola]MCW4385706.1 type II toxin-antitoxin system VapB family antitoxin [Salinibacterium sedimenticola]